MARPQSSTEAGRNCRRRVEWPWVGSVAIDAERRLALNTMHPASSFAVSGARLTEEAPLGGKFFALTGRGYPSSSAR